MLCGLGIPVLLVDAFYGANTTSLHCDMVSMENLSSTYEITAQTIAAGARQLGFVGDATHCNSFQERWLGFCSALTDNNLPVNKAFCIMCAPPPSTEPPPIGTHRSSEAVPLKKQIPICQAAMLCPVTDGGFLMQKPCPADFRKRGTETCGQAGRSQNPQEKVPFIREGWSGTLRRLPALLPVFPGLPEEPFWGRPR